MKHSIFLIGDFPSATQAYFLSPLLHQATEVQRDVYWWSSKKATSINGLVKMARSGDQVLVCRYLSRELIPILENLKEADIELIYFMDDDLLDPAVLLGLPVGYAWRLWGKITCKKTLIAKLFSQIWVSNAHLAQKYQIQFKEVGIKKLSPLVEPLLLPTSPKEVNGAHTLEQPLHSIEIAYHATWSHKQEMQWLAPILEKIQARYSQTQITIMGDARAQKIYNKIPRVKVLKALPWTEYVQYTKLHVIDIGLAPLLPSMFNEGRSPIKFFDYARCHAAGIFSDCYVYNELIEHQTNGLLLKNDPDLWFDQLCVLIENTVFRKELAHQAQLTVLEHTFQKA
jgi:hypothetical protein